MCVPVLESFLEYSPVQNRKAKGGKSGRYRAEAPGDSGAERRAGAALRGAPVNVIEFTVASVYVFVYSLRSLCSRMVSSL